MCLRHYTVSDSLVNLASLESCKGPAILCLPGSFCDLVQQRKDKCLSIC